MKNRLGKILSFVFNPRLLLCFGIAWFITNGWSYVMLGFGTYFGIGWMTAVAAGYLTFLWLPVSPEKIVTFAIAIGLLRLIFPHDTATLAVLKRGAEKAREALRRGRKRKSDEDSEEKSSESDENESGS